MSGSYAGGYHGTGDFQYADPSGSRMFRDHERLKARGAAKVARASARRAERRVASRGPGVARVGEAATSGPGLGVVTSFQSADEALLPRGPGVPAVGAPVGGGPGNGVVLAPGPRADWYVGTEPPIVTENYGGDLRTSIQIGGVWIQPAVGWSDAQLFEQAYGDDGPVSWLYSVGKFGADVANTADMYLGRPRAGLSPEGVDRLIGETGHQMMLDTQRKLNDVSWY